MARATTLITSETMQLLLGAGFLYIVYKSDAVGKISEGVADIGSGTGEGIANVGYGANNLLSGLGGGLSNVGGGVYEVGRGVGAGVENLGSGFEQIGIGLKELQKELGAGLQNFLTQFGSIGGSFESKFGNLTFGTGYNLNNSVLNDYTPSTDVISDTKNNMNTTLINNSSKSGGVSAYTMPKITEVAKNPFGGYSPVVNGKMLPQSTTKAGKKVVTIK